MVSVPGGPDGGDQSIIFQAGQTRLHEIAAAHRRFNTIDNQIAIYRAIYPNMSDDCLVQMPTPSAAAALGLDDLKGLNKRLAQCWRNNVDNLGDSSEQPVAPGQPYEGDNENSELGYSGESGGSCGHDPTGIFKTRSWTGKGYDSPVKDQGHRGSCVAFGIIGALENSLARHLHRWVNLSEQALYAKAKLEWGPSNTEGTSTTDTVASLVTSKWEIPAESVWPYNQSLDRVSCPGGCGVRKYVYSCTQNSGQDVYSGEACSDTVHQGKLLYGDDGSYFWTPDMDYGGDFSVAGSVELADIEDPESASLAMVAVSFGYGVVVSMDAYQSFINVQMGHTGPYGQWLGAESSDHLVGSHALQLSGVVSSQDHGGGWLVLRNSWGTCWGDGGYAYIPYAVADSVLTDVTAILADTPPNYAPVAAIKSPHNGERYTWNGLQDGIDFVATASDFEDGSACCGFAWRDDGFLLSSSKSFEGSISALGPGGHKIKFTATDSGGKVRSSEITIYVDNNSPPVLTVQSPTEGQTVYVNTPLVVQASATDPNQPGGLTCSSINWLSSDPQDSLNQRQACQLTTTFTTPGDRTIEVLAVDDTWRTAQKDIHIHVLPVPSSGPPIVTITSPFGTAASPAAVSEPAADLTMQAAVVSPGGFVDCQRIYSGQEPPLNCVSYTWTARVVGNPSWSSIGSTKNPTWNPQAVLGLSVCHTYAVEAKLCVKDPNGTTCKSTFLTMMYPPC